VRRRRGEEPVAVSALTGTKRCSRTRSAKSSPGFTPTSRACRGRERRRGSASTARKLGRRGRGGEAGEAEVEEGAASEVPATEDEGAAAGAGTGTGEPSAGAAAARSRSIRTQVPLISLLL